MDFTKGVRMIEKPKRSIFGILSVLCGVIPLLFLCVFIVVPDANNVELYIIGKWFFMVLPIVGIGFGVIELRRINAHKNMSIIGIILNLISPCFIITIIITILALAIYGS
jgi:hypothetical protein